MGREMMMMLMMTFSSSSFLSSFFYSYVRHDKKRLSDGVFFLFRTYICYTFMGYFQYSYVFSLFFFFFYFFSTGRTAGKQSNMFNMV